mmetsp:Transcript_119090/g.332272  ORF Transcript_119090/g.332272 Transcript_119090/m.332272 type:complete len:227 (+) Transcript_119090:1030-1710(+)
MPAAQNSKLGSANECPVFEALAIRLKAAIATAMTTKKPTESECAWDLPCRHIPSCVRSMRPTDMSKPPSVRLRSDQSLDSRAATKRVTEPKARASASTKIHRRSGRQIEAVITTMDQMSPAMATGTRPQNLALTRPTTTRELIAKRHAALANTGRGETPQFLWNQSAAQDGAAGPASGWPARDSKPCVRSLLERRHLKYTSRHSVSPDRMLMNIAKSPFPMRLRIM